MRINHYIAALGLVMLGIFSAATAHAQLYSPLPKLQVVGNHLETVEGKPVSLRGVSLCEPAWQNFRKDIAEASSPKGWNSNVIRIPVHGKEWERLGAKKYLHAYLDPAVETCKKNKVYCIIDWHEISNWQDETKIARLKRFWSSVAWRYADEPNILYEVFNEPTGPGAMTRENWLLWREQAQQWVNQIRADAPDTIILVGSPHWSQMPHFAVQDPFEGKNLAYVMHLYPGWSADTWDKFIGNPSKTIPIFISEWGWSSREKEKDTAFYGTQEKFGEPLRSYLDARPHISWTAWSYHEACGPAMLGGDKDMGNFVKTWLRS